MHACMHSSKYYAVNFRRLTLAGIATKQEKIKDL